MNVAVPPQYRDLAASCQKAAMPEDSVFYRRNLPHIHRDGYPLFITTNLVDSLPAEIVKELKTQREQELKTAGSKEEQHIIHSRHFGRYDEWLDRCQHGHRWLESESIAQIVADEIQKMDNDRYRLMAYCIMPNHIHLLIQSILVTHPNHNGATAKYPVTDTLRLLKGRTARFCNLELDRSGAFWHHESYDHYPRSEKETESIILYIINNPVKAGLVKAWQDWKFTYVNPEFGEW
jgi:REP element-mobilizing transposase RayT